MRFLNKWCVIYILLLSVVLFFYFKFNQYLLLENLKKHHHFLYQWVANHYYFSMIAYLLIYIITIAASLPGAIFLTLAGGFLFGVWLGTIFAVLGACVGATLFFLTVKLALGDWVRTRSSQTLLKMENGFRSNAFYYLLMLRLIPIFPSSLVTSISALSEIRLTIFLSATFLGIIPTTFIYAWVGHSIDTVYNTNQITNLTAFFQP